MKRWISLLTDDLGGWIFQLGRRQEWEKGDKADTKRVVELGRHESLGTNYDWYVS